jgi:hypothetical protein
MGKQQLKFRILLPPKKHVGRLSLSKPSILMTRKHHLEMGITLSIPRNLGFYPKNRSTSWRGGPESNWLCLIIWPVVYTSNSAIFTCYIWDISHIWWEIKGYTVYIPMFSSFLVRLQFRAMLFCRTLRAWAAHNLVLRASVLHLQKMATHFFWVLLGPSKSLTISCGWIIWT